VDSYLKDFAVRGIFPLWHDAEHRNQGIPPPPLIFGIMGLAKVSLQNLDVKELRSQNLDSKGLLLARSRAVRMA